MIKHQYRMSDLHTIKDLTKNAVRHVILQISKFVNFTTISETFSRIMA